MSELERLVDEFEDAWFVGNEPRIEDYLDQVDKSQRNDLLLRLIHIEIEYRQRKQGAAATDFIRFGEAAVRHAENYLETQVGTPQPPATPRSGPQPPGLASPEQKGAPDDKVGPDGKVGPYRLLKPIGEGGMGQVFLAQQDQPVRRRVALKIIKSGLESSEVIARFAAERQALAVMEHPNIARILDVGTTDRGEPFFAMEYVDGVPLTVYCDQNQLGIEDRLQIFRQVCMGVQHAHQKGIIHRDLKPSNILVGEYDGNPVPKVIDFGLAKALNSNQRLTDQSIFTKIGQVLGTLKYMSPEQAGLDPCDVDTRTDVYSLGVILFELLTGSTPLDSESFQGRAIVQILELVQEFDSPRPSSQLATTQREALEAISACRKMSAARLRQLLAGELDWIVLKALDKEPDRRYPSAASLAEDVGRYLQCEVIEAKPPSLVYRCSKFVRKNLGAVFAMVTILAVLVGGIAGTWLFAVRAQASAKRSRDVLKVVTDAFQAVDPAHGGEAEMTARDVLLRAKTSLETSELDDRGKALLSSKLTICFLSLGDVEAASSMGKSAVVFEQNSAGESALHTLQAMSNMAHAHLAAGRIGEAIKLQQEVRQRAKQEFGPNDPHTIDLSAGLATALVSGGQYAEAIELYETLLEFRRKNLGNEDEDTLLAMGGLANAYQMVGRPSDALPLLTEAVEQCAQSFGDTHPHTLRAKGSLAYTLMALGRHREGVALYEVILPQTKLRFGASHPDYLTVVNNLASSYGEIGREKDSMRLYRETYESLQNKLGLEHPDTINTMNNLGSALSREGNTAEAVTVLESALASSQQALGEDHPLTITASNNLASAYGENGQYDEALELYESTLELNIRTLGERHPFTIYSMSNLAGAYERRGRIDESIPLFEKSVALCKEVVGENHPNTAKLVANLADAYEKQGRVDDALQMYRQVLTYQRKLLGDDHPGTIESLNNLAVSLHSAGNLEESASHLEEAVRLAASLLGEDHRDTIRYQSNLSRVYEQADQLDKARRLLEKTLAIRERDKPDEWKTIEDALHLSTILIRAGTVDLGRNRLRKAERSLQQALPSLPASKRFGLARLVAENHIRLAEVEEKPAEIERWKKKLERINDAEKAEK